MPMSKILKKYASQLGFPKSENLARIFEILYDEEDDLKVIKAAYKPRTIAELVERTELPEERVRAIVKRLMSRGALGHKLGHPELIKRFAGMIQLRDASVLHPDAPQELFELWEKLLSDELPEVVAKVGNISVSPITRIIPIESTVEVQNTILDPDSVRKIFEEADLISVMPCACRTMARKVGRGKDCPAPADSVCMQTNAFAETAIREGVGIEISKEEALRRLELAEQAGLVHQVRNNIKKDMFVCNCCSCCCTGLYLVNQIGFLQGIAKSRFQIKLDAELCSGCGTCEDRCQFHAITVEDVASIDTERCFGCGNCALTCPEGALHLEEVRPLEYIRVS
jgi:ferredoxin